MGLREAKKLVQGLIFQDEAALAMRPAPMEVSAIARAVVLSIQGYTGVPADMVAAIAQANAARFIKQWLAI